MSDTAEQQEQQQIPQDRVSLLQSDGNVFPYIPPQLARQKAEERLTAAMGRISDLELLVEFYSGEMQRLAQENQQLRARLGQPLPPNVVPTDSPQDASMSESESEGAVVPFTPPPPESESPPANPRATRRTGAQPAKRAGKRTGGTSG